MIGFPKVTEHAPSITIVKVYFYWDSFLTQELFQGFVKGVRRGGGGLARL